MTVPHDYFDEFQKKYNKILAPIIRDLKKKKLKPSEIDAFLDSLFKKYDIENKTADVIVGLSVNAAVLGGANVTKNMAEDLLKNNWFPGDLTLSERLHNNIKNIKIGISTTIKETLGNSVNWNKTAQKISKIKDLKADLPKYMKDLIKQGKKVLVEPAEIKAFNNKLKAAQKQIDKLSNLGYKNPRLKKAYTNIIKQVQKGSIVGLEKGIERAVLAKTRYYAERIARTEIAAAYGNAVVYTAQHDKRIVAIKSVLSARHPKLDICDVHSKVNQYGIGRGVFPKYRVPPFPYHVNCMCSLVPLTDNQITKGKKVKRMKQINKFKEANPKVAIKKNGKIPHLTNEFFKVRKPSLD